MHSEPLREAIRVFLCKQAPCRKQVELKDYRLRVALEPSELEKLIAPQGANIAHPLKLLWEQIHRTILNVKIRNS